MNDKTLTVLEGDCREKLRELDDQSIQCCVTSPPYFGLRNYGHEKQIGLEQTPDEYIAQLVKVFSEVKRVLKNDGTLWVNIGDSYAGNNNGYSGDNRPSNASSASSKMGQRTMSQRKTTGDGLKNKDLIGIPWMLAFALRADGWYLRQDIIWSKPNPMPESVTDRCTKAHEYIFLLSKSQKYFFDNEAIAEPSTGVAGGGFSVKTANAQLNHGAMTLSRPIDTGTRNKRSVWNVATTPYSGAHFATFPPDLIKPCILAGCPVGGTVLDPFGGSGTTGKVAIELGRKAVLVELNANYLGLIEKRTQTTIGFGW